MAQERFLKQCDSEAFYHLSMFKTGTGFRIVFIAIAKIHK